MFGSEVYGVITDGGTLLAWGNSDYGHVSDQNRTYQQAEVIAENIRFVENGQHVSLAIDTENVLWGWPAANIKWLFRIEQADDENLVRMAEQVLMLASILLAGISGCAMVGDSKSAESQPADSLPPPPLPTVDYDAPDGFFVQLSYYRPDKTERLPAAWNIETGEFVVRPQTGLSVGALRLDLQDWSDGRLRYEGNGFTVEVTDEYDYIYTPSDGSEPKRFTDTAKDFVLNGDVFSLNDPNLDATIILSMAETAHGFTAIYCVSNMVFQFAGIECPDNENRSYFLSADFHTADLSIHWAEPLLLPDELSGLPDEVRIVGSEYLYVNDGKLHWGLIGSVMIINLEFNAYELFDTANTVDPFVVDAVRINRVGYLPDTLTGYYGEYAVFSYDLHDETGDVYYLVSFALRNGKLVGACAARNTRRHVDGQSFVTFEVVTTYDGEGRPLAHAR